MESILIDLIKELIKLSKTYPPDVGISIVHYDDNPTDKDHLRINNIGHSSIHNFRLAYKKTEDKDWKEVKVLKRVAKDVFGNTVTYELKIPKSGIYIAQGNPLYIELNELEDCKFSDDIQIEFKYEHSEDGDKDGSPTHITKVKATDA